LAVEKQYISEGDLSALQEWSVTPSTWGQE
jgi:orotate phosphoribosyltransferase